MSTVSLKKSGAHMSFISKKVNGIIKRLRCANYGMFYLKNADFRIPHVLKVNGTKKNFQFIDVTDGSFISEFTQICLNDCYHLKFLKRKLIQVDNIVDIGANQGLFLLAARQVFPSAAITGYEPNRNLSAVLDHNAELLTARIYYEAVLDDCMVQVNLVGSDLATTTSPSLEGTVQAISLKTLVDRHGSIDILKLDCEGAEWQLLLDETGWLNVKALVMEYHLWGKNGATTGDMMDLLDSINFKVLNHTIITSEQGLIIAMNKF